MLFVISAIRSEFLNKEKHNNEITTLFFEVIKKNLNSYKIHYISNIMLNIVFLFQHYNLSEVNDP